MKTKQKREERAKLVADARKILDSVKDGEAMTGEQTQEYDRIMARVDTLKDEIDRLEKQDALEAHMSERVPRRAGREAPANDEVREQVEFENRAFDIYMRRGLGGMPAEMRDHMERRFQNAQSSGNDAAGGYLVPEGFYGQIVSAELAFGAMLEPDLCFSFDSETGNPLPIVTDNDASNEGEVLTENTEVDDQDVTFGRVILNGPTFSSKIILVPNPLLQDSAFKLDAFLAKKIGTRIGRAKNRNFTIGDGSNKPTGVVNASTLGVTAASATVIAPDELIDLEHSVDPAYRTGARYMMHDSVMKQLKKKKDGQGRYLWQSGIAVKEPDTLNGYRYSINQHMASAATGQKAVLFGNFQNYWIRNVKGIMVMRLVERYAEKNQTAFIGFERADGNLIDAGTHPIKHLLMA